jgi:hypothetical protein
VLGERFGEHRATARVNVVVVEQPGEPTTVLAHPRIGQSCPRIGVARHQPHHYAQRGNNPCDRALHPYQVINYIGVLQELLTEDRDAVLHRSLRHRFLLHVLLPETSRGTLPRFSAWQW